MRAATRLGLILLVPGSLGAQTATPTVDLKALADSVAPTGSTLERTRTLVHWVNDNFTWSYTDYVKRTPQEIVARRAGNCAELASVLRAFLDASGTKSRWIREINVQPQPTPRRQNDAAAMVAQRGLSYSVFGLQHNDHVWLEVWDDATKSWFPADPAYGVVGLNEWLPARLAMANRPKPRVAAVAPIAADMLVPFVVVAGEKRSGPFNDDRTDMYLIDGFNNLYGGRLTALPSWSKWVDAVHSLSPHARAAFDGKENLHSYNDDIAKLKTTYDDLSREASAKGIRISSIASDTSAALSRSTPEREGISSAAILRFVAAADSAIDGMNSVMIVRHGRVVAEGWWSPYEASTPHVMYSLSKSFTSTAVGFAIAEGKFTLDDQVLRFFPEEAPASPSDNLRAMRVRDLLRMATGHQTEPSILVPADSSMRDASWVRRFFAHPVAFKPGTHFLYNSPATYMLSAILQKTTGQTVRDYLTPRLFEPLGIARPTWTTSPEGISAGAYGLNVRTEDIAKLGLLYLHHGVWNGKQLLPAGWADTATARQTANGSSPTSDWDQGYGFQFWRSRHGYRGDGAFGQYMLVLPEQDAVVAITSGVRDMQSVMTLVWDMLLPAMQASPLADDAVSLGALHDRLAHLSVHTPRGRTTSPLAAAVSRQRYDMTENDRGVRSVSLDLTPRAPALVVRTASGEQRTPLGLGTWLRSDSGYTNGIERMLAVPTPAPVALSGAWTTDSVFTVKLVAPETPFYSLLEFRFSGVKGERLTLASEYNVSFGGPQSVVLMGARSPR